MMFIYIISVLPILANFQTEEKRHYHNFEGSLTTFLVRFKYCVLNAMPAKRQGN